MSSVTASNAFDALGASGASTSTNAKAPGALGQQEFLNLMLAQLKNQDPTKPMDSSAFLGQLAQFSTVSGIGDLQKSFSSFASSINSSQALQAASLVGHSVLAPSGSARLDSAAGINGAVDLPASAGQVTVNVYDTGGQLIRQVSTGAQAAGLTRFHWDGLDATGNAVPAGVYVVSATAQINGKSTAVNTLVADKVNSVNVGANGSSLTLNLSGLGTVDFSTVREIM